MKRLFDIFLSSIGLVLSFPLWLLFSLAIKLEDRGPVFREKLEKLGTLPIFSGEAED
jgi:lipopolysaccharide/colanic/teichoic acid biosynthesis glycosyltransferase